MYVPGTKGIEDYAEEIQKEVEEHYKITVPAQFIKDILRIFQENLHEYIIRKSKEPIKYYQGHPYSFILRPRGTKGGNSNFLLFHVIKNNRKQ
jgi:hypothetical protein